MLSESRAVTVLGCYLVGASSPVSTRCLWSASGPVLRTHTWSRTLMCGHRAGPEPHRPPAVWPWHALSLSEPQFLLCGVAVVVVCSQQSCWECG